MNQIPWFFVVLLLIGMLIHLGLGVYSRRFKIQPVQLPFEILMYLCVVWTATFALDISSDSLAFKILLMKIRFLTTPFISLSLMLIAILFSGHGTWLTKRRVALLLIIPIITVFLALTTEYSTVFRYNYTLVQTAGGFSVLGFANGIWTRGVYLPFNYIEEAVTLLLLLQVIFGNQRLYARQALLFFVAIQIPVIADILFLFGITPVKNYNIVPSTFAFTGILLAIALFQYRFIDIVPVARNTLFERMSDPMLVIDREGRLADFNPAAEKALGLCRATNLGKGAVDILHEHEELCAGIEEKHPACRTITITIGAGADALMFDLTIETLTSGAGALPEKLVTMRDVTDRKRSEKELKETRDYLDKLIDYANAPIIVWDPLRRINRFNLAFERVSGYDAKEVLGNNLSMLFPEQSRENSIRRIEDAIKGEKWISVEIPIQSKSGEVRTALWNSANIYSESGELQAVIAQGQDITERKRIEETLLLSEAKYHTLYNNMQEGVALHELVYDDRGQAVEYKIIDVNPRFVSILKLAREFVINKLSTQAYGSSLPPYLSQYSAVAQSGLPYHFETYFPPLDKHLEISVSPWGSNGFATIFSDITERKRAQEELARYARRLIIINRMDRVVTSSLDIEQVYDRFVEDLKELVPIDRTSIVLLDESEEHWNVAMIWTGYEPIIGKGEWRDVKGSSIEWLVNQKLPLVENEIGEKGDWTENESLRQEKIRSRVLLPLIIRDKVVGVLSLASRHPAVFSETDLDILMPLSDQFSLALQNSRLYDQLRQQSLQLEKTVEERTAQLQKANKELEAFSYSVSHDLRSPLRAVDGFSRILLEEHLGELSPDAQHYLFLVRSNAVQMGKLIDDLLTFSRTSRQPLAKRSVEPAEIVRQVLEELHGELQGRNVEVNVGDLPHCQADPAMLSRVFFNLISNAVKFTRKKDEARIDIGSIDNEGKAVYFVKDNGVGFDMRYSSKLFGVFSRLHSVSDYEGTGVGLALVARIVHRHGGRVWAEADVDKGATFYFTLEGGESL
ncbi:MAG: Methanosis regulatory histidine kinase FilI [Euryarchaeota archaeon]|nr:Methanosis regulatory histidine kinase FilI [Euryarchaeota archaeon]